MENNKIQTENKNSMIIKYMVTLHVTCEHNANMYDQHWTSITLLVYL